MIKIQHLYNSNSPVYEFLNRQIKEANLEGYELVQSVLTHQTIEKHKLSAWHTILFTDKHGDELLRLERPFSSEELEMSLQEAKGILANRMKAPGFGL